MARVCTHLCTNETMFSQHEGMDGRTGRALHFDFTLKI